MSHDEFTLIDRYFKGQGGSTTPFTLLAIGDDASIHRPNAGMELVVSTDSSLQGVHWPDDFPLQKAADRAVCSALSDLAAMGANPVAVWVNVMAQSEQAVKEMGVGVCRALQRYDAELVGGDTCSSDINALAVTVAGELPEGSAMRRDGAVATDQLWMIGRVGFHALGLQQWFDQQRDGQFIPSFEEITPLIEAGMRLREQGVRCCIDVSDGLLQDASHLASASSIGIDIEVTALPAWSEMCRSVGETAFIESALYGGEDYALLFTAPAELDIPAAVKIGRCSEGEGVHLYRDGQRISCEQRGFKHFD